MTTLSTAAGTSETCEPAELKVGRRAMPRLIVDCPGQLTVAEAVSDVLISDISRTGARIKMAAPLAKGTACTLLWEGLACQCRVVWSDPFAIGVAFDGAALDNDLLKAHAGPKTENHGGAVPSTDRASFARPTPSFPPVRLRTAPRAEIWQGDKWASVRLKEMCQDSFAVTWFAGCQGGQTVLLRGEGLPNLQAVVRRITDLTVECTLSARLHRAVLDHVRAMLVGT